MSTGSLPQASAVPGVAGVEAPVHGATSSIPSFYEAGSAPNPVESHTSAPSSSAGISAFVQRIRRAQLAGIDPGLEVLGQERHQRAFTSAAARATGARPFDVSAIRKDFPILRQRIHGKPLAWLDNAATTQKPQCVIDAVSRFYEQDNSNIHRGAHTLAARATDAYEQARDKVQTFLGASTVKEIALRARHDRGNQSHHADLRSQVPPAGGRNRAVNVGAPCQYRSLADDRQGKRGRRCASFRSTTGARSCSRIIEKILGPRTKVVALTQASNSLGTILPVAEMTQMAKRYGAGC